MFHIIYKTTNTVNNKFYIGYHYQEADPYMFDGYWGSGTTLIKAIKKHGSNNFYRETLFVFDNKTVALEKELEMVNESFIKRPDTYNITLGGGKPPSHAGEVKSTNHKKKIGDSQRGKVISESTRQKISKTLTGRKLEKRKPEHAEKIAQALRGRNHTDSAKQKMSANHWDCTGNNNPCYGKTGSNHPAYGTKRQLLICPACSIAVPANVAKRWHFENCKSTNSKV